MKKITKIKLTVLAVACFFILGIASNTSKLTFGNSEKWIPADFDPAQTILLVEDFGVSAKAQRKMEAYMSEKYPYKYEFVSLKTIQNNEGKYSDRKLYKYALVYSSHTTFSRDNQTGRDGPTVTGFDYHFYDRELDKDYPATGKSSSYAIMTFKPVINTIVKKFE